MKFEQPSSTPLKTHGREETVDSRLHHQADRAWNEAFLRHSGYLADRQAACLRFFFEPSRRFHGRIQSGRVGSMGFVRASVSHGSCVIADLGQARHELALMISGTATFGTPGKSVKARAGEFVLVGSTDHLNIVFNTPSEFIVVKNPLESRHALDATGEEKIAHCATRDEKATVLAHWLQYACAGQAGCSDEMMAPTSQLIRMLSTELLYERPSVGVQRLDRRTIERYIAHLLSDASLSVATLAERCGCSVRTLHRAFHREGGESIERYIQRCRIEASAVLLRDPVRGVGRSLTELAMQFGFASSSHFSTVFRSYFGVPPSVYRQRFLRVGIALGGGRLDAPGGRRDVPDIGFTVAASL